MSLKRLVTNVAISDSNVSMSSLVFSSFSSVSKGFWMLLSLLYVRSSSFDAVSSYQLCIVSLASFCNTFMGINVCECVCVCVREREREYQLCWLYMYECACVERLCVYILGHLFTILNLSYSTFIFEIQ